MEFVRAHPEFFYADAPRGRLNRGFVAILWPRMPEYVDLFRTTRHDHYWAAGKAMQKALSAAGVQAPEWPPKEPKAAAPRSRSADLDDDIPF